MKRIALPPALFVLLGCLSCNKGTTTNQNQQPPPPPPPPSPTDTLATGWKKIAVIDSSDLTDIFFVGNSGFAAGLGPNILKSIDGGDTWIAIPQPSTANANTEILNIGMGSQNEAIFVQPTNVLISTHNAGGSFGFVSLSDKYISDVFFVNSTTAYAAGDAIWKTVDAGNNWTKLYTFGNAGAYSFYSLFFLDEQTGWVLRNNGLFKTADSGVSWQQVATPFDISKSGAVFMVNKDTGYVSSGQIVEKTTDGGLSWTNSFTGTVGYHDIHFVSDHIGYITDNSRIYRTTDGGNTWTKQVSLLSGQIIELHFTDANHGWACGLKGIILKFSQ